MNYIVLDMEWNQPPINKKPSMVPFPLVGEIIEIGAVKLDESLHECGRFKQYIKPVFYRRMQPYVKKITGISEKTIEDALPFEAVVADFLAWCGQDFVFITWGPDDMPMLCDNLLAHKMDTSFIPDCYNLQHIYNAQTNGENRQWSLAAACEFLGIKQSMPGHDAFSDAYHTSLVCKKLDVARGIQVYPVSPRPERHYCHPSKKEKQKLTASK
ncbi:MAG: exonuclease domain-containing protein [Clostridiales bacterium]|nr:exonuclease domain-containing protein [Clostridiales bacterium]